MSTRKLAAASAITALLSVGVSACDSSGPGAKSIGTQAKKNATSAKSTSMAVSGSVQGQTVTLDASGTLDGKNQRQLQSASKLKSEEYVIGNTAYFKANSDFLTANGMTSSQSKAMADTWWSKSLTGDTQSAATDIKTLLNQFFSSAEGKTLTSNNAEVKETTTHGQSTYTITDPSNPKGAKLVVTRGNSPQLVQIEDYASQLTQNTKATYTFSRWNAVPTYKAPGGAKPIAEAPSSSSASPSASSSSTPSGSGSTNTK